MTTPAAGSDAVADAIKAAGGSSSSAPASSSASSSSEARPRKPRKDKGRKRRGGSRSRASSSRSSSDAPPAGDPAPSSGSARELADEALAGGEDPELGAGDPELGGVDLSTSLEELAEFVEFALWGIFSMLPAKWGGGELTDKESKMLGRMWSKVLYPYLKTKDAPLIIAVCVTGEVMVKRYALAQVLGRMNGDGGDPSSTRASQGPTATARARVVEGDHAEG